jgi:hypothetical protein
MEIIRGDAQIKIEKGAKSITGQTFSELFLKFKENQVQAHPLEVELVGRAWELQGGISSGLLHEEPTSEMINAAGKSMLDELKSNGLLRG